MNRLFRDDRGNESSMRVMLFIFISTIAVCVAVLLALVVKESYKEVPDYSGLSLIITAFLGGGVISLVAKALQKKYENE